MADMAEMVATSKGAKPYDWLVEEGDWLPANSSPPFDRRSPTSQIDYGYRMTEFLNFKLILPCVGQLGDTIAHRKIGTRWMALNTLLQRKENLKFLKRFSIKHWKQVTDGRRAFATHGYKRSKAYHVLYITIFEYPDTI